MSIKQYRFVSPGVQVREIDNSQLPKAPQAVGPLVIGRATRGVSMRPIQLDSFSDYVEVFGNPVPGGQGGDIWRDGNNTSPMYAGYAAQAFLANQTPLTFLRLLGYHNPDRSGVAGASAGWTTEVAYGLFIAPLHTGDTTDAALAAVVYAPSDDATTGIGLYGSTVGGLDIEGRTSVWVESQGNDFEFVLQVDGKKYPFNFSRSSKKFIRRVLNTNPTLVNDEITSPGNLEDYWLGETFESHLESIVPSAAGSTGQAVAMLVPLEDGLGAVPSFDKSDLQLEAQAPVTSWVISQHTEAYDLMQYNTGTTEIAGTTKLFRFKGLNDGEWGSKKLKIGFQDIKASDDEFNLYGTFTVMIRVTSDSDNAPEYVERYANCNLDPNSTNYISRKIGDMESTWDYAETRYRVTGQYQNASRFVSVEVDQDVDAGSTDAELLPFGFYGPAQPRPVDVVEGTVDPAPDPGFAGIPSPLISGASAGVDSAAAPVTVITVGGAGSIWQYNALAGAEKFRLNWPAIPCRTKSTTGNLSNGRRSFFGITTNQANGIKEDPSYADLTRPYSYGQSNGAAVSLEFFSQIKSDGAFAGDAFVTPPSVPTVKLSAGDFFDNGVVPYFSLDDLVMQDATSGAVTSKSRQHVDWFPGSRFSGASVTVLGASAANYGDTSAFGPLLNIGTYRDILEFGYDQFSLPLVAGFDGLDITEKDPFRNTLLADKTELNSYAFNSIKRGIDTVSDPEVLDMNLAVVPGITNPALTTHLTETCRERADSLAIIDLQNDYIPSAEGTLPESERLPNPDLAIASLKDRRINNSYGCAYFPWVQARDTISDAVLWIPPSVAALGTMAYSETRPGSALWFAPAGFNRGGLTEGAAGIPVTNVRYRLTSKERDKLYEANINPIASFPSEGIVVFGNKTLQVTPSALDRINVRRLMIFLKKEVSRIANGILYDQNIQTTWSRFTSRVNPLLASVKSRFGLSDFKVVLDETTTTPDLIDRNILYAKIFLKPARTIEFIAVDFNITRTGASFTD